jgi:hypothetical protein
MLNVFQKLSLIRFLLGMEVRTWPMQVFELAAHA